MRLVDVGPPWAPRIDLVARLVRLNLLAISAIDSDAVGLEEDDSHILWDIAEGLDLHADRLRRLSEPAAPAPPEETPAPAGDNVVALLPRAGA